MEEMERLRNSTGWTPAAPRVGRKLWCRCPHAQSRPSVFPTMPVPVHGSSTFAVLLFSCGTDTMPERGAVNNDGGDVPLTIKPFVIGRKGWLFSDTPAG